MTWLPHWRFEDCMLSWASVDGSVGRHFDQFSVFLIQLNGRRHWEIGPPATDETLMVPNQPIALVEPQEPMTTWIANPGDVLYLPPNMIHHGVSLDPDCMSLSLGFRAPDAGSLLEGIGNSIVIKNTFALTMLVDQSVALPPRSLQAIWTKLKRPSFDT